jgi:2-polyprenyl-6-hydroxyphenyl methylase/3-demethylubiquinone-9 3-methyltransferase
MTDPPTRHVLEEWQHEMQSGERFGFGKNWASFLRLLSEERIESAEVSLRDMLGVDRLDGTRFLDAGSGSGLFSLAARRLGAKVVSFDYDPQSVACTAELKRRYFPDDTDWGVYQGSVLDADFLRGLGTFDVVYSWGVLHHTGAMWQALDNAAPLGAPSGQLFMSIYNDQGRASRTWTRIKRTYVRAPAPFKGIILGFSLVRLWGPATVRKLLGGGVRSLQPGKQPQPRGMDLWHDAKDWVGGYPFEVAKPERIFDFYRNRGFELQRMKTCAGGLGCNEYIFRRGAA